MTIKFHCEHCEATVSAPDAAGGKQGRCPKCHQVIYIPLPEGEELDLAPIDDRAEAERRRQAEKALQAERDLLKSPKDLGGEEPADKPSEPADSADLENVRGEGGIVLPTVAGPAPPPDQGSARAMVIDYLKQMAAGQLGRAQADVAALRGNPKAAAAAIQQLAGDPTAGKASGLPPPVLAGFLKQLRNDLKP